MGRKFPGLVVDGLTRLAETDEGVSVDTDGVRFWFIDEADVVSIDYETMLRASKIVIAEYLS